MAYMAMAYVVMAYIVMAYIGMAYIVVALYTPASADVADVACAREVLAEFVE